jgi:hypothetical protein
VAIERVARQGWFSRIRSAVVGILIGIVLVGAAGVLQFWNEGRTLRQQQLLEAGRADVVSVPAAEAAGYEGRLLHISDALRAEGELVDADFNQVAEGLGLRRKVEMFQWRERKETREETSVGGSKTTRTIYRYERDWDDDLIDGSSFAEPAGHQNPASMPFPSRQWRAERVFLGELLLASSVVAEIGGWRPMAVQEDRLPANLALNFRVDDGRLSTAQGAPEVGDLRISYARLPEGPLSVVARFAAGQLQPQLREQGELLLVERGQHSAQTLFDAAESRNAGIGWALRLGGFVLMWAGFGLVLAPLAVFADVVPAFGRLTRWISTLISGALSALISFVAIASGWLYHRPWLLGLLLIGIACGLAWLLLRRRAAAAPLPPAAPPPPPPAGH